VEKNEQETFFNTEIIHLLPSTHMPIILAGDFVCCRLKIAGDSRTAVKRLYKDTAYRMHGTPPPLGRYTHTIHLLELPDSTGCILHETYSVINRVWK
jgi:hypothetical protein